MVYDNIRCFLLSAGGGGRSTFFCVRPLLRGGMRCMSDEPSSSVRSPPGRMPSENMTCLGSPRRWLPVDRDESACSYYCIL